MHQCQHGISKNDDLYNNKLIVKGSQTIYYGSADVTLADVGETELVRAGHWGLESTSRHSIGNIGN